MVPETSKTTILGPEAVRAARSEPDPLSFRFVTLMILPPRPARVSVPKPWAPGKTGSEIWEGGGGCPIITKHKIQGMHTIRLIVITHLAKLLIELMDLRKHKSELNVVTLFATL